jgi:hypothetical protein
VRSDRTALPLGFVLYRWTAIYIPFGFYIALVLLLPENAFSLAAQIGPWSEECANSIRAKTGLDIHVHARSTEFPQVAMLASIAAIGVGLHVGAVSSLMDLLHYSRLRPKGLRQCLEYAVVCPTFGVVLMWAFLCLPGDPSTAAGLTTQSRFGYLVVALPTLAFFGIGLGTLTSGWIGVARCLIPTNEENT